MRAFKQVLGFALSTAVLLVSCGGDNTVLRSNPEMLDLGRIALTATTQGTVTLTNVSDQNATLGDINATTLGLTEPLTLLPASTCTTGQVLAPQATCTLAIQFAPETEGSFDQTLSVSFLSEKLEGGRGTFQFVVMAEGYLDCGFTPDHPLCPEDADLTFNPSRELSFGSVDLTFDSTATLTVINSDADETVTLGTISAATLGVGVQYELLPSTTCRTGQVLAPQTGSCTIALRFAPVVPGEDVFTLRIPFTEPSGTPLEQGTVTVRGFGNLNCGRTPDHPLCPEDADVTLSGGPELNFGSVDLFSVGSQVITVTNTDIDESVTLGTISNEGLALNEQFTLLPGTTCVSGQVLAANGGNCALIVQYRPSLNAYQRETLVLNFTEPSGTPLETVELRMVGFGRLNCAVDSGLADSRARGVSDAEVRNATEAARGTADGRALTYEDGRRRTYADAYNTAYNSSYESAYSSAYLVAYDAAYRAEYDVVYRSTYSDRYYQLVNDTTVCSRGTTDGRSAGRLDGTNDGSYEGYNDGYAAGYPLGQDAGYQDGVDDSYADCSASGGTPVYNPSEPFPGFNAPGSGAEEIPDPTDPAFVNGCYTQGYNATYNPNSYQIAYDSAVAGNVNYQNGLRDGRTQGTNDGNRDGSTAGATAGRTDGAAEGRALGRSDAIAQALADAEGDAEPVRQAIYVGCYEDAYADGYSAQYSYWYDIEYDGGYYAGYDDGYADTYRTGFSDVSCCYTFTDEWGNPYEECYRQSFAQETLAAGQLTRGRGSRYGQGKAWWAATGREGVMGDRFVHSQLPSWLQEKIGPARSAALAQRAATSRGMNIREALREEKRLAPPALSSPSPASRR
jgi:hypothetical protein